MAGTIFLTSALLICTVVTCTGSPTTTTPSIPDCPRGCTCTGDGLTVDCSNRGLLRLPPLPRQVTKLDLSGNLLGPMINGSFEHLRQLQEVDLSYNGLLRLQLCTFTGLLHLRRVDLHGNRLNGLPSGLFADNGQMEVLDLSHNHLDVLPDLLLHSVPLLKVLNVSHNEATFLKLGRRFQMLTQISVLDLSHNPFTNLTQDAFESANMWDHQVARALDLSHCQFHNIHPQALRAVPGLKALNLAGNSLLPFQQIVDVLKELETSGLEAVSLSNMTISDPALFSEVSLMALRALDLSMNVISSVPASTFGNVRSLRKLDISQNLLTGLDAGFEDLVNLVELNISHCRLTSFKGTPVGRMQHLTSLDLSHNQLLEASEVDLTALRQLRLLDLSYNVLRAVVLPGDCTHLETLSFTSNALTSLPSMADMRSLKHFSASDNSLQSLTAFLFTEATDILLANFSNNDLTTVDHRAFLPASPRIIDLSSNLLTRTQFFSWTGTREVYLHNNKLNDLDQQTFYGMNRLKVLDLQHNNLSVIGDETFKFLSNVTVLRLSNNSLQMGGFSQLLRSMESLEDLDLGYNQISNINASSFQGLINLRSLSLAKNRLRVIPAELFHPLERLVQADISGNPFDCDCELLPLQEWLKTTTVKIKQRFDLNITNRCVTPAEHRGKMVTMFTVGQFQCDLKMLYMIIFGSIGGLGILVGIIASLVCHYRSKRRRTHYDEAEGHKKTKANKSDRKETNKNKVDLVRISKRPDPYGKEELINGWVESKQFTIPKQNTDHQYKKPGPGRPPWPEQLPARNKKDEKGGKEKGKERGEGQKPKRAIPDKRIRSVSEMVPLRSQQRQHRTQSMVPVWDDMFFDKHQVVLRPRADRWTNEETYPTWHRTQMVRPLYQRDTGRFYTLPYPSPWPRFTPYGPDYPYRIKMSEEQEERYVPRQPRVIPYSPRQQDLRIHKQRPLVDYQNNQRYYHDSYADECARDYENLRESRNEGWRLAQEERAYREDFINARRDRLPYEADRHVDNGQGMRHDRVEYENDYQSDSRHAGNNTDHSRRSDDRHNGDRHSGEREHGERENTVRENGRKENQPSQGASDKNPATNRGTSEVQVHRRDSDYRNAMEHPVGPKTKPSPSPTEEKTSDWL